jgi:lipopolysaccharide/colanic/teichoic acid biosynthesis glycosyltransferase
MGGKRIFDVTVALGLLALTVPVFLVVTGIVWAGSGRPIFFGHQRLGRDGRLFRCWKFRTMMTDAEKRLEGDPHLRERHRTNGFKLPNGHDPRVTAVGTWLRRTYVDELPQLFNVLNGTMSLVGPRPIVPDELECFGPDAHQLLRVKPGIFGAWTAMGAERPDYPERAGLELSYVREHTFGRDLAILLRSVPVVLRGEEDG